MIEGGSKVLSSFLHAPPRADGSDVVDTVVVTVAPTFIGVGVGVVPQVSQLWKLKGKNKLIVRGRMSACQK
jgi:riboflavin biosynthesis pyrimidine reductase